ncbi:hypothetical protein DXX92_06295 [Thalassotalea euphylliae]|uniref:Uncharacterized protein n=1 Tax=Thalassotalea euphylliae TaxID=1655234 RepID=A0A3E0UEM1_9GAMM|nr:hypothetical protein DXX92_06295 [Thalassotalea euphylliae]
MNPLNTKQRGSVCLNFLLCWHLFMENNYTTQVPPSIKPKQTAAKTTLKGQHALIVKCREQQKILGVFKPFLNSPHLRCIKQTH